MPAREMVERVAGRQLLDEVAVPEDLPRVIKHPEVGVVLLARKLAEFLPRPKAHLFTHEQVTGLEVRIDFVLPREAVERVGDRRQQILRSSVSH